jgi:hypothetical protein
MTFTFRSIIELIIGLGIVSAAIVIGMKTAPDTLYDLLLGLFSLSGIVIIAHAVWLAWRKGS